MIIYACEYTLSQMKPLRYQQNKAKQLWQSARNGDRNAFDQFFLLFVQPLYRYGTQLVNDPYLVEEAIQELFIYLWEKRAGISFEKEVKNYLMISLRRRLLLLSQKNKPLPLDNHQEQFILPPEQATSSAPSLNEKTENIKTAIKQLPKRQKEALFLKYYEHMDYEEIAQLMNLQKRGVYKLVSVGLKKLRKMLTFMC